MSWTRSAAKPDGTSVWECYAYDGTLYKSGIAPSCQEAERQAQLAERELAFGLEPFPAMSIDDILAELGDEYS